MSDKDDPVGYWKKVFSAAAKNSHWLKGKRGSGIGKRRFAPKIDAEPLLIVIARRMCQSAKSSPSGGR
jgi:hypothetical protein